MLAAYTWIMLAAYATCDDYPHNAYPWRFLNLKIYWLFGVHAGIMFFVIQGCWEFRCTHDLKPVAVILELRVIIGNDGI